MKHRTLSEIKFVHVMEITGLPAHVLKSLQLYWWTHYLDRWVIMWLLQEDFPELSAELNMKPAKLKWLFDMCGCTETEVEVESIDNTILYRVQRVMLGKMRDNTMQIKAAVEILTDESLITEIMEALK